MTSVSAAIMPSTDDHGITWPESGTGVGPAVLSVPAHLGSIASQLRDLTELAASWNSYAARPITTLAVSRALQLLIDVDWHGPLPSVSPTPSGGVQFEWGDDATGVELEIGPDGSVAVLVAAEPGRGWEATVTGANDARLVDAFMWAEKLA